MKSTNEMIISHNKNCEIIATSYEHSIAHAELMLTKYAKTPTQKAKYRRQIKRFNQRLQTARRAIIPT